MVDAVTVGTGSTIERFDAFMERCLYGPNGFYATTGTAGRKGGDFITSPEIGPLFGATMAEAIEGWWEDLGRPEPFRVFDVGCGPGTLLKAIAVAKPDRPWELIGVDRVGSPGARISELPEDLSNSVVVANELLDNLPFRVVEQTEQGPAEVYVIQEGSAPDYREVLVPLNPGGDGTAAGEPELSPVLTSLPIGSRAPLLETAARWVASVLDRQPSVVCLFDYGTLTTAELVTRGGWLRTYRDHQRGADPLVAPGHGDITTDVAWDQLPPPDRLERQREALTRWGVDDLVEEGRRRWKAAAHAPDLTAVRMRSRVSEVEALLDPDGLGNWWVALWRFSSS